MGRDVIDFNADYMSTTNTSQAMLVIATASELAIPPLRETVAA